jgi:hypothetical protein
MDDTTDDQSTEASHYQEDGCIRLGDDGRWKAQEQPEEKAHGPTWPKELHATDDQPDSEAVRERPKQGGPFVRERHGQHHPDGY